MIIYSLTHPSLSEYFETDLNDQFFNIFISDKNDSLFQTNLGLLVKIFLTIRAIIPYS